MTPDALARLDALHPELRALARDCDDMHTALTRHVRDGAPLDAVLVDAHRELVRLWRVLWWAHERPRGRWTAGDGRSRWTRGCCGGRDETAVTWGFRENRP